MASIGTAQMLIRVLADISGAKAGMAELQREMTTFNAKVQGNMMATNNAFGAMSKTIMGVSGAMKAAGALLTTYVSIPLAVVGAVGFKAGMDIETAFAGVKKTLPAEEDFVALKNVVTDLAMELGISAVEISKIMQAGGQMGLRGTEQLKAFTEVVTKLTVTTGVSASELSMMLGKFSNIMGISGLKGEEFALAINNIGNVLTNLGNRSATTEKDILKFGVRLAAAGSLVGMGYQHILAIAAAAEASGTKAERGGTALTKIFLAMRTEQVATGNATKDYTTQVTTQTSELKTWQARLVEAKEALNALQDGGTDEEIAAATEEVNAAEEMVATYTETLGRLKETQSATNGATMSFAKLLGYTTEEYKKIMGSANGAKQIFTEFIQKIGTMNLNMEDTKEIMEGLGLTDTRLVQMVYSLAAADTAAGASMSSLTETIASADAQMRYTTEGMSEQLAMDTEVANRLNTVSQQWERFIQILKVGASVLYDAIAPELVDFLKNLNNKLSDFVSAMKEMPQEKLQSMVKMFAGLVALGPGLTLFSKALSLVGASFGGLSGVVNTVQSMTGMGLSKKSGSYPTVSDPGGRIKPGYEPIVQLRNLSTGQFASPDEAIIGGRAENASWLGKKKRESTGSLLKKWFSGLGGEKENFYDKNDTSRFGNFMVDENGNMAEKRKPTMFDTTANNMRSSGSAISSGVSTKMKDVGSMLSTKMPALPTWLSQVGGLLGSFAPLVQSVAVALGGWAVVLGLVVAGLTTFFVMTGKSAFQIKLMGYEIIRSIEGFGTTFNEWLTDFTENILPAFVTKFTDIFPTVLKVLTNVILTAITTFWQIAPKLLDLGVEMILMLINGFVAALPSLLDSIIAIVTSFAQGFMDNLPQLLETGFKLLVGLIDGFMQAVPMLAMAALELIFKLGEILWNADWVSILGAIVKGIGDVLAAIGKGVWDGFWAMLDFIWRKAGEFLGGLGTLLWNLAKLGFDAWFTSVKLWFKTVFDFGKLINDYILKPILGIDLFESGKEIVNGLLEGLNISWSDSGKWFSGLGKKLQDGWNKFWGIKSPSRVMMYSGQMIGKGLAVGLEDSASEIEKASALMNDAVAFPDTKMAMDYTPEKSQGFNEDFIKMLVTAMQMAGVGAVYIDGKEVTDKLSPHMALSSRKAVTQW